jgi:hypothetical protein
MLNFDPKLSTVTEKDKEKRKRKEGAKTQEFRTGL